MAWHAREMKHAGAQTLSLLEPLLARLRALPGLVERTPGCFYRKGSAWLHFHEHLEGLFADVKLDGRRFERLPVRTDAQQAKLLALLRGSLPT